MMRPTLLMLLATTALIGCGSGSDGDAKPLSPAEQAAQRKSDPSQTPEGKAAEAERQRLAQAQGEAMKRASGK